MKKNIFGLVLLLFLFKPAQAQLKIGYVDSATILDSLTESQDAQARLDAMIQEWQEELTKLENEWKDSYDDYDRRKLVLSDKRRAEIEKSLVDMENNISNYRQQKFGVGGELFQKQDELMKPIQNKVFNAIKSVSEDEDLDFVFDRSGDLTFLYAKDKYDITKLVLEKLR